MTALIISNPLFTLGKIVITPNASEHLSQTEIRDGLQRHASGDWGVIPVDDARSNNESLRDGGGFLSAYGQEPQCFWVITDADRSVTTVLMPDDY